MSQCATCHGGCCRAFAVPVSGADILRITSGVGLSFWDVACRWEDPHAEITRGSAPRFHFADSPQIPYAICLLHEASRSFPGTTKCRFLRERETSDEHPLPTAECSIYGHRPGTCRSFPAALNGQGGLRIIDVPEYGRRDRREAYRLCPQEWHPADFDEQDMLGDLNATVAEMQFFALVAEIWNRHPQAWEIFPDFLQLVYEERDELERRAAA